MARANKYASINFNHVYDKNLTNNNNNNPSKQPSSSNSSGSYSTVSSYKNHLSSPSSTRSHGRMLVLTRPTPKPVSNITTTPPLSPSPQTKSTQLNNTQDQAPDSDLISLRPSGRTGSSSFVPAPVQAPEKEVGTGKFVPPHLRPGFIGREEKPGPEVFRGKDVGHRQQQQQGYSGSGSPGQYGEDGRPKSGGGYERMRRGGESDLGFINRPRSSSGNRPSSSGWYVYLVFMLILYGYMLLM